VLFSGFRSTVELVTVAVFVIVPIAAAVGVTKSEIWTTPCVGIEPRSHVTVPAACEQVPLPWSNDADVKFTPAGRGSISVTFVAVSGPLLKTVSRYRSGFRR
jgi:hypothetical protein